MKSVKSFRILLRDSLSFKQRLLINAVLNRGDARYLVLSIVSRKGRVHQTSGTTAHDRYPRIFKAAQALVEGVQPRILSFGCSTGEEVLSLRQYFPDAVIIGAEVKREALEVCRALTVDERVRFIDASKDSLTKHGPYDAIFCMAVLQRIPHVVVNQDIRNLKHLYPFHKFDDQVSELDGYLKCGGILLIKHSQYMFRDTKASNNYETAFVDETEPVGLRLFDRNSCLLEHSQYFDVGFRKLA